MWNISHSGENGITPTGSHKMAILLPSATYFRSSCPCDEATPPEPHKARALAMGCHPLLLPSAHQDPPQLRTPKPEPVLLRLVLVALSLYGLSWSLFFATGHQLSTAKGPSPAPCCSDHSWDHPPKPCGLTVQKLQGAAGHTTS